MSKKLKRKKKVTYEKMRCKFVYGEGHKKEGKRCKRNAVGKSTLCKKHGGNKIIAENLLPTLVDGENETVKYNPEIHLLGVIQLAQAGFSMTEIAANFGVCLATLNNWAERYQNFYEAMQIAKTVHEAWWIMKGKRNLENVRFQTPLYKFLTGNLLGYSDKIESKNMNLNVHGVLMVPGKMSDEEWEAAAADNANPAN